MIDFSNIENVYLSVGPTDLRKSIDGYAAIVAGEFHLDPFSNSLFIFCNRQKNKIKMIYWDGNGFWLLFKRLEKSKFKWPKASDSGSISITHQQFRWLLEGLNIEQPKAFKPLKNVII